MHYFVVTCPENGWDCVIGLYYAESSQEVANLLETLYGEDWEDRYIIHHKYLETV